MGSNAKTVTQLQPRRLREWVPGFSLLQTSKLQLLLLLQPPKLHEDQLSRWPCPRWQNYHEDCEALINKQINMEFYASYVYLSMSSWFNRDDQALHGFAGHFKTES